MAKLNNTRYVRSVYFSKICPGICSVIVQKDLMIVTVLPNNIYDVCLFISKHSKLKLNCLLDIWAVDYPNKKNRFEINYLFTSLLYNYRVIVKTSVSDFGGVDSLTNIFSSAGWLEREVWDMYGVSFYNNYDLRRILTDYGFEGHPLRKDYPLSGFYEIRYDDEVKRVVYEPIEVGQEYRNFKFNSPWELL